MRQVDPVVRATLVARLRDKQAGGVAISADVRRAAAALAIAESTVWRWLSVSGDSSRSRRGYELTEADRDGYVDWCGNVAALRRDRITRGEPVPPLRTLQRAFAEQMSPGERAAAVEGAEGRRRHEVYLRREATARNARWEGDHKELPVLVIPPRGIRACKPWATLFLDCYSRLIMGWALSLQPNSATVLAALRRGLVVDPERGPWSGVRLVGFRSRWCRTTVWSSPRLRWPKCARRWGSSWSPPIPTPPTRKASSSGRI
ncbi:MAG TPA: transposase family protein [Pseudonocardiaceae bacterium]|nr:transposase family protein [Pseudonocardiaceae bacterium]